MKKPRAYVPILLIAVFCLSVISCSVNPSEIDDKYAVEFIKKVKYVKDKRTGMCYAIIGTRMTGNSSQNGISFTWVPNELAEPYLVNK
jgi:hypothetical protein